VHDPTEGVNEDGIIVTGALRSRVAPLFEPVLDDARRTIDSVGSAGSLYLYGSVATGMATPGRSDVDLLTIDVAFDDAAFIAAGLWVRHRDICRAVEIATAVSDDYERTTDDGYGNRVFLRHYCVHLTGPVHPVDRAGFPADARAARGFNGDIADHARRWQDALDSGAHVPDLARRIARKTLLAVAGLASIYDRTWTTDRARAAFRWAQVRPTQASGFEQLLEWTDTTTDVTRDDVQRALERTIAPVVAEFASTIGLWTHRCSSDG
jgi:uncharacterized protein